MQAFVCVFLGLDTVTRAGAHERFLLCVCVCVILRCLVNLELFLFLFLFFFLVFFVYTNVRTSLAFARSTGETITSVYLGAKLLEQI